MMLPFFCYAFKFIIKFEHMWKLSLHLLTYEKRDWTPVTLLALIASLMLLKIDLTSHLNGVQGSIFLLNVLMQLVDRPMPKFHIKKPATLVKRLFAT